MEGGRLTQEQIAKVLRRAAELDQTPDVDHCFEAAAVEEAALEVGLSSTSVSQALAELHVGALESVAPGRPGLLGLSTLAVQRMVPGPRSAVDSALRAWLSGQLFEQRRQFGDRELWARREGMLASVRRGLDLNHRIALNGVRSVEFALAASPTGDGKVLVCLRADVHEQRMAHAWSVAVGAAVATGTGGALLLVDPVTLLASLPLGVGATFGGHLAGRAYYRREVGKVETALDGLLDRIEHRPPAPVEVGHR